VPRRLFGYRRLVLKFLDEKKTWIEKGLRKIDKDSCGKIRLTNQSYNKKTLKNTKTKLENRVRQLAQKYNFRFNKISVRNQSSRWGSCSSNQTLSFNWRLILLPQALVDYVIYHELVHLEHSNHSKAFWQRLAKLYPKASHFKKKLKNYIY